MEVTNIWNETLEVLQKNIPAVSYQVWIDNLKPYAIKGNTVILISPLESNRRVIQTTYRKVILDSLAAVNSFITDFTVVLSEELPLKDEDITVSQSLKEEEKKEIKEDVLLFNKAYTFDNFVIGSSNQIAYHAAKAVAEYPGGTQHNPLFIYGGVGLGKTHIMQAIGNFVTDKNPDMRILYITTDRFVNDFVDSLRDKNDREGAIQFRMKYRNNVDMLMIDDIQFLEKKGATQDALFNTFNDLYQHGKQIVFTSDRHPKDIDGLNERLLSRFQSGLTVDISKPDLETRAAILKKKAMQRKFLLPDNIIEFIAEKIDSNIRELEGALSKVIFYCSLADKKPDNIDIIKDALKDYIDTSQGALSTETITEAVCDYFSVPKSDVLGKKKTKTVVEPRQIAIYIINELLSLPLTAIGEYFGGRDHTTVMHARDKISSQILTDPSLARKINDIKNIILKK